MMIIPKNIKRISLILIPAAFFVLNACKNDTEEINKAKSIANDIENLVAPNEPKDLKNKTPLNKQELEDAFPLKIGYFKRDYLQVSEEMSNSEGAFGDGTVHLKITDAAGPLGNSLITMFGAIYDFKQENSSTVTWQNKIRNKLKTINRYETDTHNSSIEFIYNERFHMLLTAKKMTPDELWNLFEFDKYIATLKVLDDLDN